MDRALKERVIGAIVLVGVAVLVVPIFLDGPSGDTEIVSKAVALPGQSQQQSMMQTVVLNRDRQEPVPASKPPATEQKPQPVKIEPPQAKPEAKKEIAVASQIADSKADSKPDITMQSATGMWAVQLGSFSNQQNAERLAAELRAEGYAAFLSKLDTGSGALHRVRIGPQKDRDSAESVAARLGQSGHTGQVVPHP
jgi:DedD protein